MMNKTAAKVAVLQFPGSNCENETARSLRWVGLEPEVFRWNRDPQQLRQFDAYILPGGFTYEDRVRAGVIAAKEPLLDTLVEEADQGKPVLGICNGAQILLEAGMLPGFQPGKVQMALAHNYFTYQEHVVRRGHHCGWVHLRFEAEPTRTPFTQTLARGMLLPMTVSHNEGRFTSQDQSLLKQLDEEDMIVCRYCDDEGNVANAGLPVNPNGSVSNIAGLCSQRGNVMALMPHPERAFFLRQVPSVFHGSWGSKRRSILRDTQALNQPGPGYALFQSLADFFQN